VRSPPFADALAPGIVLAQAIGRWGNWFNNELYGRATDLPWGLRIYQWKDGEAVRDSAGDPISLGTFHPVFLYESIWCVITAIAVIWADRTWRLGHGRVFALYVAVYSLGRLGIETLRIDEATHILGLRLNIWTSLLLTIAGLLYVVLVGRLRPGRETRLVRGRSARRESTPPDARRRDRSDVRSVVKDGDPEGYREVSEPDSDRLQ
jgi:prolipoprotein diacylglyceryl transferase